MGCQDAALLMKQLTLMNWSLVHLVEGAACLTQGQAGQIGGVM